LCLLEEIGTFKSGLRFVCGWKKVLFGFGRKGKSNEEYGFAAPELWEYEGDAVISYAFPAEPQP
jgi:hypothetical protein